MSEAPRASDVDFAADLDVPIRPRGVTVSTLDSESSDRGSNPREASLCIGFAQHPVHGQGNIHEPSCKLLPLW